MRTLALVMGLYVAFDLVESAAAQTFAETPFEIQAAEQDHAINGVDVVGGSDGKVLYLWDNDTSYTDHGWLLPDPSNSIRARAYSAERTPLGDGATRVDLSGRLGPWITAGSNGNGFLVAWKAVLPNGGSPQNLILGRRLDPEGHPTGTEIPIDLDVSDFQDVPVAAGLKNGNTAIAWLRTGFVVTRVFNTEGQPVGPRLPVTSGYSWDGLGFDLAGLASGDYAVVWSSWQPGVSGIRLFSPSGEARTPVLSASDVFQPFAVAADDSGGFVAAGLRVQDAYRSLHLRYFDPDGVPRSDDIAVHTMTEDYYIAEADVKALGGGRIIVFWREYTRRGHGNLKARVFGDDGSAIGSVIEISGTTGTRLKTARVNDGSVALIWAAASRLSFFSNAAWSTYFTPGDCSTDTCEPDVTPTRAVGSTPTATRSPQPTQCGDNTLDAGEECDDGNRISGDGCDGICRVEECGNGRIEGNEACDDANEQGGDGCQPDCHWSPAHDSFLRPEKPIDIALPANQSEFTRVVPLQVRNADSGERPGHSIRLIANDGTCPPGTILGAPDFDRGSPGDQDSTLVAGGTPATAHVVVRITRDSFPRLDNKVPVRCLLSFTALTSIEDNLDPTPEDNSISVELNVTAAGRGEDAPTRLSPDGRSDYFVGSARPLRLKIARGSTATSKTISIRLGTGGTPSTSLERVLTVTAFDGDCPEGTVGLADLDRLMPGAQSSTILDAGSERSGKLEVSVSSSGFTSRGTKTPARCHATVISTSPDGDSGAASHATRLVIEVVDLNDR